MNERDVETAKEIWADVIAQVHKLPPETYAIVIKGLPLAIRKQLPGAHPTIKKALELLEEPIKEIDFNPEITPQREMSIVFSYAPEPLIEAAWEQLKEQATLSKPAVPRIPQTANPFDAEGKAVVGNNPPCHVLFEAIGRGGPNARKKKNGWQGSSIDPEQPLFRDPQKVKGDWTVAFDKDQTGLVDNWARVEGLSALHTKLGLFALAKICDPRNQMRHPNKEPVGVSYEDLRRALGLREMPIEQFKPLANRMVRDLADLKATVRNVVIGGLPIGIAECSLFVVSKVWDKQFEIFAEPVQIGWLFDPGPWAKHYFNRDAKPWLSTLQNTILELDHRGIMRADNMALHIATLLFVVAGGDQFKTRTVTKTVEELLELAGELLEPEHRGEHWAGRTKERLEAALDALRAKKLIAAVDYGPTYPGGENGKGWVESWLSATITLTSPEAAEFLGRDIPEPVAKHPARLERQRKVRKPKPAPQGERLNEITATRLRTGIGQKFPNQTEAAKHFGYTQSGLSLILAGKRTPSADATVKFNAFLDSLDTD